MVTTPEIFSAVWFGLASFFTPCMLHVIPGYLSYLMGNTISEMEENSRVKMKLWINSFGFVLGLMIIFISLGLVATGFG